MANRLQADRDIKQLLASTKVIALVGYSDNPMRDSYRVGQYLQSVGYTVYPVNPTVKAIDGLKSHPTLADVPHCHTVTWQQQQHNNTRAGSSRPLCSGCYNALALLNCV